MRLTGYFRSRTIIYHWADSMFEKKSFDFFYSAMTEKAIAISQACRYFACYCCPNERCAMPQPAIDTVECSGCGICVDICPTSVLDISGSVASVINEDSCSGCGECMEECPLGAIVVDDD